MATRILLPDYLQRGVRVQDSNSLSSSQPRDFRRIDVSSERKRKDAVPEQKDTASAPGQKDKDATQEPKDKNATPEQKDKPATPEPKDKVVASEQKAKDAASDQKGKDAASDQKGKDAAASDQKDKVATPDQKGKDAAPDQKAKAVAPKKLKIVANSLVPEEIDVPGAMLIPSQARILRVEIGNPCVPLYLTGLTTTTKVNAGEGDFLYRRQIFEEEHEEAVRRLLGVFDEHECTFERYIKKYVEIKKKYVRNVLGYGNFMLSEDLPQFLQEAGDLKKELDDLRLKVRNFLRDELHLPWIDILRFNPRLKYATFLLSKGVVRDDEFRWHIANMLKPFRGLNSVDYLLGTEEGPSTT